MSVYPAKNTKEASKLLIEVSNQLHEIVNEGATSEISTDSGLVPSVRKALSDTFLFQQPIPWEQGRRETAFNQLRTFGSNLYWAPSATLSSPKTMGATPVGDPNWKLAPVRLDKSSILKALGKINKGFWDENPKLESNDDFVVERNTGNVFGAVDLPYQVNSSSHPNPETLLGTELVDASNFSIQDDTGYPWIEGDTSVKNRIYNYRSSTNEITKVYDPVGGGVLGSEPDGNFQVYNNKNQINEIRNVLPATFEPAFSYDFSNKNYNLTGEDKSTVNVKNGGIYYGGVFSGDEIQPSNNNAVFNVSAVKSGTFIGGVVEDGYNSMSLEYGSQFLDERRCIGNTISSYLLKGSYMGLECFSSLGLNASFVSDRHDKTQGNQHGLRVTGYGENHLGQGKDLRNIGNNYRFVSLNYANGLSRQTGSYGNLANFTVNKAVNGITAAENTTLDDAISSSNNFNFAIYDVDANYYIDPRSESFRGTIGKSTGGFESHAGNRGAKSNSYDLTMSESGGGVFDDNFSRIYFTGRELTSATRINGDGNIVDVVIDEVGKEGAATGLQIAGKGNTVRVSLSDVNQAFSIISISGNNNKVHINVPSGDTNQKVAITGNDNTVTGYCTIGTVTGTGNDYSGVKGYSMNRVFTAQSSGGRVTQGVSMSTSAYAVSIELLGSDDVRAKLVSRSATQLVIDFYDSSGTKVDGTYTFYVIGRAYQ